MAQSATERHKEAVDGTETHYVVDSNQPYAQVIAEQDDADVIQKKYVFGHDLISQNLGATTSFFQYDSLGTTRDLSDGTGLFSDSYLYDAFGELLAKTGTTDNNYRYTGEQYDTELDNYYLRARYYNQSVGRFTQMDDFEGWGINPVTLNKYIYAGNDPIMFVDLSGNTFLTTKMIESTIQGQLSRMAGSSLGISLARSKGTKQLVWNGACFVIEEALVGVAEKAVMEGIYLFIDTKGPGKPYVGQSKKVPIRLQQHVKAKRKFGERVLMSLPVTAKDPKMLKEALDVLEQWTLDVLLGEQGELKKDVSNKKMVIGKKRKELRTLLNNVTKNCGK